MWGKFSTAGKMGEVHSKISRWIDSNFILFMHHWFFCFFLNLFIHRKKAKCCKNHARLLRKTDCLFIDFSWFLAGQPKFQSKG